MMDVHSSFSNNYKDSISSAERLPVTLNQRRKQVRLAFSACPWRERKSYLVWSICLRRFRYRQLCSSQDKMSRQPPHPTLRCADPWPVLVFSFFLKLGYPGGASGKKFACQCRKHKRRDSIPGSGRYLGGGNGIPLQYSCLGNPMDRGAWRVAKSRTRLKRLSTAARH